jgi:DNA-binding GntR family transcriptional regulator
LQDSSSPGAFYKFFLFSYTVYEIELKMYKISNDELGAQAYKKVRSMIILKKLLPGQKIVQDKLADSLGISRTPLRSALQMLEAENLIESVPRKGVIVKEFSDKEIIELYDCRIALEGTAASLFTRIATDTEIARLAGLFQPFLKSSIDPNKYQIADSNFHDSIIQACGNSFLSRLFQQGNILAIINMVGLVRPPEETLNEHLDIISAMKRRDAVLVETLVKSHLDKSKQLIINKMNEE